MVAGMIKAVFLDRDGVILIDKKYQYKVVNMEFAPRAIMALKEIPSDYLKIIISYIKNVNKEKI